MMSGWSLITMNDIFIKGTLMTKLTFDMRYMSVINII